MFQNTFDTYCRRYRLSPSQRAMLRHAVSGLSGPQLASALGTTLNELKLLENLFNQRTGRSLAKAVEEFEGVIRHRSRPPSGRAPRPASGVAPRPGVDVRSTGTEDE